MSRLLQQSVPNRLLASLTALTFVAVLAGCSNDDDAPELDETTDASDPATTEYIPASADGPAQNVPEPKLPAVATENTEEGAEATLKYFWEAIDYARLTGETAPIALVAHDTCEFCDEYIAGWTDRYETGDWVVLNGEIEIEVYDSHTYLDDEHQDEWTTISYELTEPGAELFVDGKKDTDESFEEGSTVNWLADLSYDGTTQRWQVEWSGKANEDDTE